MPASFDFIERLGLAPDAGERDVRRAYARELKLVDQERDLEGFQYLRGCYEAALGWVQYRDGREEPEDDRQDGLAPDGASVPPSAPDPDSPQALSAAAFAEFHARLPSLVTLRDNAVIDDPVRTARWTTALREALGDPRLLNLDARQLFEEHIVTLLAAGWQPGHHLLFEAADNVFGWSRDAHVLERFGYPGDFVAAALDQRAMSRSQQFKQRMDQRNLLALLRARALPDDVTIEQYVIALRTFDTHFPDLLAVMAPDDVLPEWRRLGAKLPVERLAALVSAQDPDSGWNIPGFLSALVLLIWVITQLSRGGAGNPDAHAPQAPVEAAVTVPTPDTAAGTVQELHNDSNEPDTAEKSADGPTVIDVTGAGSDGGKRLPPAWLRRIASEMRLFPAANRAAGAQTIVLQVRLGADGKVENVRRLVSLADPALADAFEEAVRRAGPYPLDTAREFDLQYRPESASR